MHILFQPCTTNCLGSFFRMYVDICVGEADTQGHTSSVGDNDREAVGLTGLLCWGKSPFLFVLGWRKYVHT